MANTLAHVRDLHWIVVEDANETKPIVERLLKRSKIWHSYFSRKTPLNVPKKGWHQRDFMLAMLRANASEFTLGHNKTVLYFGDDDNTYDVRLFDDYIRRVKKIGVWAVGFPGGSLFETPILDNGTVVGFDVNWGKFRKFGIDMAGFAVSLEKILSSCIRGHGAPETCFLEDLGFELDDLEPFGFEQERRELLVWHTNTQKVTATKMRNMYGFDVEYAQSPNLTYKNVKEIRIGITDESTHKNKGPPRILKKLYGPQNSPQIHSSNV